MIVYHQAMNEWNIKLEKLKHKYKSEPDNIKRQTHKEEYTAHLNDPNPEKPPLDFEGVSFSAIYYDLPYQGSITRNRNTIHLNTEYSYQGLSGSLPAIVAWMRDLGCDVTIEFMDKGVNNP